LLHIWTWFWRWTLSSFLWTHFFLVITFSLIKHNSSLVPSLTTFSTSISSFVLCF
jgi:hypothetical protein